MPISMEMLRLIHKRKMKDTLFKWEEGVSYRRAEREKRIMGAKWLEQRWAVLLPELERRGKDQEEEIRALCEAEIAAWRVRPSFTTPSSLRTPMTDTRNQLRQLAVTPENSWVNPKTGDQEHLALKYMNFSEAEWVQLGLPSEQRLQQREAQQLWLRDPDALVKKGAQLLQGKTWPEVALGIVMNTGRSLAEVLYTGRFMVKTLYTLELERPSTRVDRVRPIVELPTFSPAPEVLEALLRVRRFGGEMSLNRQEVSRQDGLLVREEAYRHFLGLVPLRIGDQNLYQQLFLGVYPCLAVYYYCPASVEELTYMATIQGHERVLTAATSEERRQLERAGHYHDYRVVDARKGIRLGFPGVEVLEVFQGVSSTSDEEQTNEARLPEEDVLSEAGRNGSKDEVPQQSLFIETTEAHIQVLQEVKPIDTPAANGALALVQDEAPCEFVVRVQTRERFDAVARELGTQSDDETLVALLNIYERVQLLRVVMQWLQTQETTGKLKRESLIQRLFSSEL